MTTPISGGMTPDYSKEVSRSQIHKTSSHDFKGVRLTKDSLEIPFEMQSSLNTEQSEAGRPALAPLLMLRMGGEGREDLSFEYYQQLRNALPDRLQSKLTENEQEIFETERDPYFTALNASLKFEADLMAFAATSSKLEPLEEGSKEKVELFSGMPMMVQKELIKFEEDTVNLLTKHFEKLETNDLRSEELGSAIKLIEETLSQFKYLNET